MIGTETELCGHPHKCECIECRAWREFRSMWEEYRQARTERLWEIYVHAFVNDEPEARAEFYRETSLNRHARRRLESKARKINGRK